MPYNHGALFSQGMAIGANIARGKREDRHRQQIDERRLYQAEQDSELDREFRRKQMLRMEVEHEANKADAARLLESEVAFNKFGEVTSSIDWSTPDAAKQYQQAVNLHLPTMLKHEGTLRKFEALNRATVDGARYTDAKQTELQMLDLQKQLGARGLGPEGITLFDDVKAGKLSKGDALARARELMDAYDTKIAENEERLRRISNPDRAPNYQAATLPTESSKLKRLESLREDLRTEMRKKFPGGEPKVEAPGTLGRLLGSAPDDSKAKEYQSLKTALDDLDREEEQIAKTIEGRARGAGMPDPDASRFSSGGPTAPRSPSAPGGKGSAVNRYKIEVINPGRGVESAPPPSSATPAPPQPEAAPGKGVSASQAWLANGLPGGALLSSAASALSRLARGNPDAAQSEKEGGQTLLDYVKTTAGHFEKPAARTAFGKNAIVGTREWDIGTAVEWAKDRVRRLEDSKIPRDREELAKLRALLEPYLD